MSPSFVCSFVLFTIIAWIATDVHLYRHYGNEGTISYKLMHLEFSLPAAGPAFGYSLSALIGHLFWPTTAAEPAAFWYWLRIIGALALPAACLVFLMTRKQGGVKIWMTSWRWGIVIGAASIIGLIIGHWAIPQHIGG